MLQLTPVRDKLQQWMGQVVAQFLKNMNFSGGPSEILLISL